MGDLPLTIRANAIVLKKAERDWFDVQVGAQYLLWQDSVAYRGEESRW